MKLLHPVSLLFTAALLTGCGASPVPPTEQINSAEMALNEARNSDALNLAGLELRRAQDGLEKAKQAVQQKEFVSARRLAKQAEIDAKLAEAKSEAVMARKAAQDMRDSIQTLQEEINRKTQ